MFPKSKSLLKKHICKYVVIVLDDYSSNGNNIGLHRLVEDDDYF